MAMRAQFFEGTIMTPNTFTVAPGTQILIMGRIPATGAPAYSGWLRDYRGGMGRIQFTKATEFLVVEHIASSPVSISAQGGSAVVNPGAVQVRINTTNYFLNPDGSPTAGIPGIAAPYPRSTNYQDTFGLDPDVYVLPGQNWEIVYTVLATLGGAYVDLCRIVCKYTLYDGTDAVIANKLLEMGVSVKPANIDWYKRMLIQKNNAK